MNSVVVEIHLRQYRGGVYIDVDINEVFHRSISVLGDVSSPMFYVSRDDGNAAKRHSELASAVADVIIRAQILFNALEEKAVEALKNS